MLNKKYEIYRIALSRLAINKDFNCLMDYLKENYCEKTCLQESNIMMVARIAEKELVEKIDRDMRNDIPTYDDIEEDDRDER